MGSMPYTHDPDKITYFAETDYRSQRIKFGIRDDDRARHMYIIGKTGMGKSTLLENLAIQDIQNGEGVCFIDPHGGTAETLLSYVPEHRIKDVIYFAPFDQEYPVGMNVLEDIGKDKRPLVASGLMGAFKKVWVDAWSARMEYILNNAMLALLETPGTTLLGVNRIFADKEYRNMIVANVTDPSVKAFWVDEYAKYSDKFATEATAAIQNKVGQFAANPIIRNMIGQPKSTFDLRDIMDSRKIFIVNLSKGRMGEGNANLVGSMLITKMYLAAMSRADVGAENVKSLPPFYLYVDEFQSFANESFADILSEARKYKLALTVAHQYIEQMSDEVRAAVFGNVGTMISFRVGSYDAEVLEKEFAPMFLAEDIVNLGFAQVYLKLMIRGIGSPPFSAKTLPRPKVPARNYAPEVIASSRANFARPREVVEEDIRKWHEPIPPQPRDPNLPPPPPETKKYAPGMRPARPPQQFTPSFPKSVVDQEVLAPPLAPPHIPSQVIPAHTPDSSLVLEVKDTPQPTLVPPVYTEPLATPFVPPPLRAQSGAPIPRRPEPPRVVDSPSTVWATMIHPAPTSDVKRNISPATPQESSSPSPHAVERKHQPFRAELEKLKKESVAPTSSFQGGPPKQEPRRPSAPLSVLKSQPKRDKGPSEGNLTGLKAALALAQAKHGTPPPRPVAPEVAQESPEESKPSITTPSAVEVNAMPISTPQPPPLTQARSVSEAPSPTLPPPTPPPMRPPLLNIDETPRVKEVPRDVLLGILAD